MFESDRVSEQGGSHVGSIASCDRPEGGREPDLEPPRALRRRPRRSGRPLRPHGRRRCRTQSLPGPARRARGGHGVVRVERVGSGAEEGVRERLQGVHQEVGDRRQGQHRRPQHVPGADQHLPPGPAAGRVHVVRRLPDAVLRVQGPAVAARRRLGAAQVAVRIGVPERVEGRRRALLLRPDLRLSLGGALPQERVEAARLQGPEDLGPVRRARQEDAGRRAHADRLHGQGRLARNGHLRHHQHADERL